MWQKGRFWLRGLGLLLMLLAMSRRAEAAPSAQIDVYTMGPGDDLFSRFGHAAICVTDELSPQGRCYNYGTADFSTPGPLTWGVIRGDGQFWVSVVSLPRMMLLYQLEDRTLYRQRLPLSDAQTAAIVTALHRADRPEQTLYNYRHFDDNCTTRIRDLVDEVTGGALRRGNLDKRFAPLRARVYDGFAAAPLLSTLSQLVLGRRVDAPITGWDSMFLPDVLRAELASHLLAAPEVVYQRQRSLPPPSNLPPLLFWSLLALGLVFLSRLGRVGRIATLAVLTLCALVPWSLLVVARLPELRVNEALLVLWPTDFVFLQARYSPLYARLRLAGLVGVIVGKLLGILVQPLWGLWLLASLPLLSVWQATTRPRATDIR
jgi:hypothetical protein